MKNAEMHAADVATFTERISHLRSDHEAHEAQCERSKAEIFQRLGKIERLIFIGIGAIGGVGGLATFFGWNILKLLGK